MAERRLLLAHLGDRAAVALQAAIGHQRRIAATVAIAAGQEGADRGVVQLTQVVALPVAADPVAVGGVVHALELQV